MRTTSTSFIAILLCLFFSPSFSQTYNFDGLADGATGTFANGWYCNTTTGYRWEANKGGTPSGGTGPTQDHTLGNSNGVYMYVEASTPAAAGDVTRLESPNLNLGSFSTPGVRFWFHKAGAGMGNLYIDVYHNNTWINNVDSIVGSVQTAITDPWQDKVVNLTAYAGATIKVRFRAVYGTSWSGDMAIDDVSLIELPPYEAQLVKVIPSNHYYSIPKSQTQTVTFSADVRNNGVDTITNVKLYRSHNSTLDSGSVSQILPESNDTISITSGIMPTTTGYYNFDFYVGLNETDTINENDSAQYQFYVSDSVYSRENDSISLGIGFTNATGIFGQMFQVFTQDTLTAVRFKLVNPTLNDDLKVKIYHFTNGAPGAIIDSTASFNIPSSTSAWYSVSFPCDKILAPGKYFIAVEQLGTNNLSFGYTPQFYEPGVTFFKAGATWSSFESSGFNVSLGLRAIFGTPYIPTVSIGNDTAFCTGNGYTLDPGSGYSSYLWNNNTTGQTNTVFVSGTYSVKVTTATGCAISDTVNVTVWPAPQSILTDQGICSGQAATLQAGNVSSYQYNWSTGSTTDTIVTSIAGTYYVTITDTNSCTKVDSAVVKIGAAVPDGLSTDSVEFCQGDSAVATITSSPSISYLWSNGDTGTTITINGAGLVWVKSTNDTSNCFRYDSIFVTVNNLPTIDLGKDTTICKGDSIQLSAGSFAGYNWNTGANSSTINVSDSGIYIVTVTDNNGCKNSDSILIDTDICTGISEYFAQNAYKIYPNPAKNFLNILSHLQKNSTFKLINIQGSTILNGKIKPRTQTSIHLNDIPQGVYFLEIRSGLILKIERLVIHQ